MKTTEDYINYLLRAYCAILNINIADDFAISWNQGMKAFPLEIMIISLCLVWKHLFWICHRYLQISSDKLRMHGDSWKQHTVVQNKPITVQGILMLSTPEAGQFKTQVGSKIQLISFFLLTPQLGRLFFTNSLRLSFRCSLRVLELVIFSADLLCSHTSSQHH